eukprot:TRINITY_DN5739_c0_g2_i1.p1 TRINITY_DN5739_c0_g2~~TRINITY_DN5739_c0_g2_i1.p1  ORF type:complete len:1006 (+),score=227.84 TRINITY_DN5739_c0_g2_i1:40-3018(+)
MTIQTFFWVATSSKATMFVYHTSQETHSPVLREVSLPEEDLFYSPNQNVRWDLLSCFSLYAMDSEELEDREYVEVGKAVFVWQNNLGEIELRLYDIDSTSPPITVPVPLHSPRVTQEPCRLLSLLPRPYSVHEFFRSLPDRLLKSRIYPQQNAIEEITDPYRGTTTISFQCTLFMCPSSDVELLPSRFGSIDILGTQERVLRNLIKLAPTTRGVNFNGPSLLSTEVVTNFYDDFISSGLASLVHPLKNTRFAFLSVALENNLSYLVASQIMRITKHPEMKQIYEDVSEWVHGEYFKLKGALGSLVENSTQDNTTRLQNDRVIGCLYSALFSSSYHIPLNKANRDKILLQMNKELHLIATYLNDLSVILDALLSRARIPQAEDLKRTIHNEARILKLVLWLLQAGFLPESRFPNFDSTITMRDASELNVAINFNDLLFYNVGVQSSDLHSLGAYLHTEVESNMTFSGSKGLSRKPRSWRDMIQLIVDGESKSIYNYNRLLAVMYYLLLESDKENSVKYVEDLSRIAATVSVIGETKCLAESFATDFGLPLKNQKFVSSLWLLDTSNNATLSKKLLSDKSVVQSIRDILPIPKDDVANILLSSFANNKNWKDASDVLKSFLLWSPSGAISSTLQLQIYINNNQLNEGYRLIQEEKENATLFEDFVKYCNEKSIQQLFDLPLTPKDELILEEWLKKRNEFDKLALFFLQRRRYPRLTEIYTKVTSHAIKDMIEVLIKASTGGSSLNDFAFNHPTIEISSPSFLLSPSKARPSRLPAEQISFVTPTPSKELPLFSPILPSSSNAAPQNMLALPPSNTFTHPPKQILNSSLISNLPSSPLSSYMKGKEKDEDEEPLVGRRKGNSSPPLSPVKGIGAGAKLPPDMEPEFGADEHDNANNLSSFMNISNDFSEMSETATTDELMRTQPKKKTSLRALTAQNVRKTPSRHEFEEQNSSSMRLRSGRQLRSPAPVTTPDMFDTKPRERKLRIDTSLSLIHI